MPPDRSESGTPMGPVEDARVLYVDDERGLLDVVARYLERESEAVEVVTESAASDGLQRLAAEPIDCVVSDYDMPGMDGLAFLRTVREEYGDLPFLLYTGKGSEEIASEAISAGVTDYLQKEAGTDQYAVLANRVENAVAGHQAQRQVRQGFRAMETAREGISLLDEDGRFVYVNDAYADIVGYDRETLLGEHWELVYPEEDVRRVHEEILPAVPTEGRWTGESVYVRADGERILVDHAMAYTDDGTLICLIADRSNGTADGPLVAEDAYVDHLLDAVAAIFLVLDLDGTILRTNDAAIEATGHAEDELVSMHATEVVDEADRTLLAERIEAAVDDGRAEIDTELVAADGARTPYEFRLRRVTDGTDEPFGVVAVGRDVTERRRRERRLSRQTWWFEQFASVLRHDLRTPLQAAVGNVDLAWNGDEAALSAAQQALERLDELVDDFAAVMRDRALVDEVEPVDLEAVARSSWGPLSTRDADLVVADPPVVRADERALTRLLENLFSNAVEHGSSVTVTVGALPDGFVVADDGPGIPPDERERVFDPGYTTKADGTGFGLASVSQIAFAHGWDVRAAESEDGGARFEVTGVAVEG